MAEENITRIEASVRTAAGSDSGTDGWVYLCIGGREFLLDTPADDFPSSSEGTTETFVLGEGANVSNPGDNDPRNPQLHASDLDRFPTYIRFGHKAKDDVWHLERVDVAVTTSGDGGRIRHYDYRALADNGTKRSLRLGAGYGAVVHLASVY
jgi:hypothetical protein